MNTVFAMFALLSCTSAVISGETRLYQPIHEGASKLPDDYDSIDQDGTKLYGLLRIPASRPTHASGCMLHDICSLEFTGQYEAAFARYEALMQNCSDSNWLNVASLGRGETASVILRRTPCGTLVAAKIPVNRLGAAHNAADCAIMRRLKSSLDVPECAGCFPRYYYYSNITGICYNQYIPSVPMGRFLHSFDVKAPTTLQVVKTAFHQAIDAVAILQAHGIVHRDLLFKNMLVKVHPDEKPPFRVTIIDFCWAGSQHDPEAFNFSNNALGHFTRPGDWRVNGYDDMYAVACNFADKFYKGAPGGKYRTACLMEQDRPRVDRTKLEYVIWRMTQRNRADRVHDPTTLHRMLDDVTSF